jgi:hypothetical protein
MAQEEQSEVWATSRILEGFSQNMLTLEQWRNLVIKGKDALEYDLNGVGLEAYGNPEVLLNQGETLLRWRVRSRSDG